MDMRETPAAGGPAQSWDAAQYGRDCRFVADLGRPVVDWLQPKPGERILDLGCGDGALTAEIAASGATVVAADADPDMVAATRARGLDAHVKNGTALDFDASFDAVFSNAALHWMKPAEAVATGIARALKPGGRFVAELGGAGNVERVRRALVAALDARGLDGAGADPWYFPTSDEYAAVLQGAGLRVIEIQLIPRVTELAAGMTGWLTAFSGAFTSKLPEGERAEFLREVEAALVGELRRPDGSWWADYVRLRVRAVKDVLP